MFYPEELSPRRKLMFSMWDAPNDGKVRAVVSFDATNLNAYIASLNQQSAATGLARTSITHAAAKAIGTVALQAKYDFNGHFFAGRFFRHKDKAVGILVATDDGKDLGAVKIAQIDQKGLLDIASEVAEYAENFRRDGDESHNAANRIMALTPSPLLAGVVKVNGFINNRLGRRTKLIPSDAFPMGRAIISSLGMHGVEMAFPPLVRHMHVPMAIIVCAAVDRPVAVDGSVEIRPIVNLCFTFDHRFSDGLDMARTATEIRAMLEDPQGHSL